MLQKLNIDIQSKIEKIIYNPETGRTDVIFKKSNSPLSDEYIKTFKWVETGNVIDNPLAIREALEKLLS